VKGTKDFHWCGKKRQFGKQLCFDHEAKAFIARKVGSPVPTDLPEQNGDKK
jgi:hypothetical protein